MKLRTVFLEARFIPTAFPSRTCHESNPSVVITESADGCHRSAHGCHRQTLWLLQMDWTYNRCTMRTLCRWGVHLQQRHCAASQGCQTQRSYSVVVDSRKMHRVSLAMNSVKATSQAKPHLSQQRKGFMSPQVTMASNVSGAEKRAWLKGTAADS